MLVAQEVLRQQLSSSATQYYFFKASKRTAHHYDFRYRTPNEVQWLSKNGGGSMWKARSAGYLVAETLSPGCEDAGLKEAVEALDLLVQRGSDVDTSLFYGVLKRCRKDLLLCRRIHAIAARTGHELDPFLANHIIAMYASHKRLEEARQVFTKVAKPNAYMWASISLAYAQHGQPTEAIDLYRQMRKSAVKADSHVFVAVLKACSSAEDLVCGKEVHAEVLASGMKANMFVGSSLVNMYAKCGRLQDARRVFDSLVDKDVVTWTTMVSGYAQNGFVGEALALYDGMQQEGLSSADPVMYVCLVNACATFRDLQKGKELHAVIRASGLESDVSVGNCLVDMYSKCGSLEEARAVFDRLSNRDVVTWNAMIAGYSQHGQGAEALALHRKMDDECGGPADEVTFVCLLQACADVGALHQGRELHGQTRERGLDSRVYVGSSLVDMYAKCGSMEEARRVFDNLSTKDVVTWNALLNGYSENGEAHKAMQCFEYMYQEGFVPNEATFTCLLAACSHLGLVQEGQRCFRIMLEEHGIEPSESHYNCMVDLLGRAGHLAEAEVILRTMVCEKNVVGWTSLLSACKSHNDFERGKRCFDHLVELEPESASAYVLLGNIYANASKWNDVDRIESLRKSAQAWKKPAKVSIEVGRKVHEFTVGEDRCDVASKLESVNRRLKEEGGHVAQTALVLRAVSEQEKEDALCGHAEKLALAFGLLNTPDGTPLLVTKNLRMCNDCHSSTKIMSRLERREIIVRDAHRVHRFRDGSCSCMDRH